MRFARRSGRLFTSTPDIQPALDKIGLVKD
jgi:hypothetical protein